jgi:hypothetical protein
MCERRISRTWFQQDSANKCLNVGAQVNHTMPLITDSNCHGESFLTRSRRSLDSCLCRLHPMAPLGKATGADLACGFDYNGLCLKSCN